MTDEQLAITKGLAKWMGWTYSTDKSGTVWHRPTRVGEWSFRPFENLNDARLLLVECKDRGLMANVVKAMGKAANPPWRTVPCHWVEHGLLATPEQITLAVWKVVGEQGKDGT